MTFVYIVTIVLLIARTIYLEYNLAEVRKLIKQLEEINKEFKGILKDD